MVRVSQIKDNRRVRSASASVRVGCSEVDASVEVQRSIGIDVDIQCLVISGRVDQPDRAGLHKIVGDDDVLLVGSHFYVVGPYGWLILVRVVQSLGIVKIGYVKGCDMVRSRDGGYMG